MSDIQGMRACTKCETPLGLEMKFCRNCGSPVQNSLVDVSDPADQLLVRSSTSLDSGSRRLLSPEMNQTLPDTMNIVPAKLMQQDQQTYTSNIGPAGTERALEQDSHRVVRRSKRRKITRYITFVSLLSAIFVVVLLAGLLAYSYIGKRWQTTVEPVSNQSPAPAPPSAVTENAAQLLDAARADLQAGRNSDALEKLDRAIQLDGANAEQYKLRGDALVGSGRYPEAIESYQQAVSHDAGYFDAYSSMAQSYEQTGQDDQAITAYSSALNIKPNESGLRFKFARVLQRRGRLDEARKNYEQVASSDPQLASVAKQELNRLNIQRSLATGIKPTASPVVTEPVVIATPQPETTAEPPPEPPKPKVEPPHTTPAQPAEPSLSTEQYIERGTKQFNEGNPAGALKDYQSALKRQPGNDNVYYLIGLAYEKMGNYDAALESYDRCRSGPYVRVAQNHVEMLRKKLRKK
jgi:tetratricopeptide (TPR) repeat protein